MSENTYDIPKIGTDALDGLENERAVWHSEDWYRRSRWSRMKEQTEKTGSRIIGIGVELYIGTYFVLVY